jgi:formate/nitrite transporter FocA (FNT family)
LRVVEPTVFTELARPMIDKPAAVTIASAIGAGWLMGLLSWLVVAARDTVSQIFFVWVTTMVIALARLHHSVAGSIEVLMGVFAGPEITATDYGRFLGLAVLGNAIGGSMFVALLKFGSVRTSANSGGAAEHG